MSHAPSCKASHFDMTSAYRTLYRSDVFDIGDFRCAAPRSRSSAQELADAFELVFLRRGAFEARVGDRRVVLSPLHGFILSPGRTYEISHPVDGGDECTVFRFSATGWEAIAPLMHAAFERPRVFISPMAFAAHRVIFSSLGDADPLAIEEETWQLLETVGASWLAPRPQRISPTVQTAVTRVEEMLLARPTARLTLRDISLQAQLSRFHLSRAFKQFTGYSIHRYQIAARLRIALRMLEEGATDLTGLSLDLGFADHSHFTNAFRREFGYPPSKYRTLMARRAGS